MEVLQEKIALQLFSLRDACAKDFPAALKQVADLGYAGVQFAGYWDLSASELRRITADLGLKLAGSHVGYAALKDTLAEVIDYNLELGSTDIVCSGVPRKLVQDVSGWKQFAQFLGQVADACAPHGLRVSYHNHSWELQPVEGEPGLDVLFRSSKQNVYAELDLGWLYHAGADPVQYLKKYSGRCPLIHVKDFAKGHQIEVGCGELNLPDIIREGEQANVEWYIIETEEYRYAPLESVRIGLENMMQNQQQKNRG